MDRPGLFGAALAVSLDNFFPPIPREIILPLAGFAARPGSFPLTGALIATTVGSVCGAAVLYWLGRVFGRERAVLVFERTPLLKVSDLSAPRRGSPSTAARRSSSAAWCRSSAASSPSRPASSG